ncbi:MAG: hypothetical protein ACKVT0_19135, partial [Planctomycetaceae bacterium]
IFKKLNRRERGGKTEDGMAAKNAKNDKDKNKGKDNPVRNTRPLSPSLSDFFCVVLRFLRR